MVSRYSKVWANIFWNFVFSSYSVPAKISWTKRFSAWSVFENRSYTFQRQRHMQNVSVVLYSTKLLMFVI